MKKIFCDICGKEIKGHLENKYTLTAERRDSHYPSDCNTLYEIDYADVCEDCIKAIETLLDRLAKGSH